jgi:deoxyribonuclease-4
MNTYDEWTQLLTRYQEALGEESLKRLHVHLSGIEYSAKGERKHLPLAEADLDLKALFTALADLQCAGRILCESPAMEDDALKMKAIWLEMT